MSDIFISYKRQDREIARKLAEVLEGRGWDVFWDRDIPPGKTFDEVIEAELEAVSCVVVLWSATSIESDWVKTEASEAAVRDILVPARLEDVKPPLEFRRIQAADLIGWDGREDHEGLADLIESIESLSASAQAAPEAVKAEPRVEETAPRPAQADGAEPGPSRRWLLPAALALAAALIIVVVISLMPDSGDPPEPGDSVETPAEQEPDATGTENTEPEADLPAARSRLRREIYDARSGTQLPGVLVRAEGDPETDDPTVTEVYENVGHVYNFFLEAFDRDSMDGEGMPIVATVHYGQPNAFWHDSQMAFGEGAGAVRKFTGLSIVATEFTHGVVQHSSGLQQTGEPGMLWYHYSDVFAVLVEQWRFGQTAAEADWLIGKDILAPEFRGIALRSLKAPGTAYEGDQQPGHMSKYREDAGNDQRINTGIPNRAFYIASAEIGGPAWEKTGLVWYKALLVLRPSSTLRDLARTTFTLAGVEFGRDSPEQLAVLKGWQTVGVSVE